MDQRKIIIETVNRICDSESYPREVFCRLGDDRRRRSVNDVYNTSEQLWIAADDGYHTMLSTYGFPNGRTKQGAVPRIDTIFIDFDFPSDAVYTLTKKKSHWEKALRPLLWAVSEVARGLVEKGADKFWRASLSGHKGVHFFLDFPTITIADTIDQSDVKRGMGIFAETVVDNLDSHTVADLREFVDVDSSDLARMARMPNTLHPTATERFDEPRYCVPVTLRELIGLDPEGYAELCGQMRLPDDWERTESKQAQFIAEQSIYSSSASEGLSGSASTTTFDRDMARNYKREHADGPPLEERWWQLEQTPCIKKYVKRDDQFDHGGESHVFELFAMKHLIEREVPYESIVDTFSGMRGFDESETRYRLDYLLSTHDAPIRCDTVWDHASEFCLGDECAYYRDCHPS